MHKTTPVRHHPDIRWVVVVTAIVVTALSLILFVVLNFTRTTPLLVMQNEQQAAYIQELTGAVKQLGIINGALQEEVKKQHEEIGALKAELEKYKSATTTKP